MSSRGGYNKAYYEKNKDKLREVNRIRQALMMQDEEKRKLKGEVNRKRYHQHRQAFLLMQKTLTSCDSSLSLPGMDSDCLGSDSTS
jgi:hypothetical protein